MIDPYSIGPSSIAELLHYHATLGNGYVSPLPDFGGLVVMSCLPQAAENNMLVAESKFAQWHYEQIKEERQMVEMAENNPAMVTNKEDAARINTMRKRLSGKGSVTWRESETRKSTLIDILANHFYNAFTYVDSGAKLGADFTNSRALAGYYGLVDMTRPCVGQDVLIRSSSTGGSQTYSARGWGRRMSHVAVVYPKLAEAFRKRALRADKQFPGTGRTIILGGLPEDRAKVTSTTLYDLMQKVFVLGKEVDDKKAQVTLSDSSKEAWEQFSKWTLSDLLGKENPSESEFRGASDAATSVGTAVAFACRVVTTLEFIATAERNPQGPLRSVELGDNHLAQAKKIAKLLYYHGSHQAGIEKQADNLTVGRRDLLSPDRLQKAENVLIDAIKDSEIGKLPRTAVLKELDGVTLSMLDELVRVGKIKELSGKEECQMGCVRKAYTLPGEYVERDEQEALAEFESAQEEFEEAPGNYDEDTAYEVLIGLQRKANAMNEKEMLPVVPLSQMSPREIEYLPKLIGQWPSILHLRGGPDYPEPQALLDDEYAPIDREGMNLWVRRRREGTEFCDWEKAGRLDLADKWEEEQHE